MRPSARGSRAFERWDWNSLLADEPAAAGAPPGFMDGSSYFPSRPEMEANLMAFAERAGIADPLRLPLGVNAARGDARRRPVRARDDRRRVPLPRR